MKKLLPVFALCFGLYVLVITPPHIGTNQATAEAVPEVLTVEPVVTETNVGEKLKAELGLKDCPYTQSSDQHVKQGQGSVYAVDIRCVIGQPFKVRAITHIKNLVVSKIGVDEKLGNYIILRHNEISLVYGHTITGLREGDSVKGGDVIGETNISGISGGVHLHFEVWRDNINVQPGYIVGQVGYKSNHEKSQTLLEQRGWKMKLRRDVVLDLALPLIMKWEGMHLNAYKDIGGDGWTIGYGSRSFPGEKITKAEATARLRAVSTAVANMVVADFPKLSPSAQAALVSLAYNCHKGYGIIKEEGLGAHGKVCRSAVVAGKRKTLGGLVNRRNDEAVMLKL